MSVYRIDRDPAFFNKLSEGCLPGLLGVQILQVGQGVLRAELAIEARHFAANGFLHAGTVVTLADTGASGGKPCEASWQRSTADLGSRVPQCCCPAWACCQGLPSI